MRGPRGGAAGQDVLVAADADLFPDSGNGKGARGAYGRAKGQSGREREEDKGSRKGKGKNKGRVRGDGRTLNGFFGVLGFGKGAISLTASIISRRSARYATCPDVSASRVLQ